MKVTLGNLLLMITDKERELNEAHYEVLRNSTISIDREVDGKQTILNEVENFDIIMIKYQKILDEYINYKKVLAMTNATTYLEESKITIIEAINTISALRKEYDLLETLSQKKSSLDRRFDGNGSSSYYKVVELNYDIKEAKDFRDRIKDSISKLEGEIQTINATTFVII